MDRLASIKERLNKATPGPWFDVEYSVSTDPEVSGGYHKRNDEVICNTDDGEYVNNPNFRNDTAFIANSRADIEYLLQRLERYETLIKQAKDKAQIIASHCAYCADSGRSIDAHNTFEKTQEIYELLRDGADETISP